MQEFRPKPGDRVRLADPTNESKIEGVVKRPPKDTRPLRTAIWSYVKVDGIDEPQWLRTIHLEITEFATGRKLDKAVGTIAPITSLCNPYREQLKRDFPEEFEPKRTSIFLRPKRR